MYASVIKDGSATIHMLDSDLRYLGHSSDKPLSHVLYSQTAIGFTLQSAPKYKSKLKSNQRIYKLNRLPSNRSNFAVRLKLFEPLVEVGFKYQIATNNEQGTTVVCSVILESKEVIIRRRAAQKVSTLDEVTKCVNYLNSLVDRQIGRFDLNNGKVRFIIG